LSFLTKHYEKVILAVFLLAFVLTLVYLIIVLSKAVETKPGDLIPHPEGKNYVRLFDDKGDEKVKEGEQPVFNALASLASQNLWLHSKKRDSKEVVTTDLMVPFKAARCPGCEKLIPRVMFGPGKKCPFCGESLDIEIIVGAKDTDKDGMPDTYELKHGLDPSNPDDANEDLDSDGFSNIVEKRAKTDPSDAKSHPPLAERLALAGVRRRKLPVRFKQVTTYDSKDKSKWLLQVEVVGRRGWRTVFKKVGDTLKLTSSPGDVYKIVDVEYKMGEEYDPGLRAPVEKNMSILTLQSVANNKDKPIKAVINKSVYENRIWVQFRDVISDQSIVVKDGDSFTVGDEDSGKEQYTLTSVDVKKKMVMIKNAAGKEFKITTVSKLSPGGASGAKPLPLPGAEGGVNAPPSVPGGRFPGAPLPGGARTPAPGRTPAPAPKKKKADDWF